MRTFLTILTYASFLKEKLILKTRQKLGILVVYLLIIENLFMRSVIYKLKNRSCFIAVMIPNFSKYDCHLIFDTLVKQKKKLVQVIPKTGEL